MDKEVNKSSRRGLLFGAAATGTAAAAILAMPKIAQQDAVVEAPKPAPEKGGGYSLTAHVKQYYSTTLI
jgi:cobalamin biosynthesis protein CbiD